ncbi:hypothetical protein AB0L49_04215, partial [Streptomyces antimycoticus]|uniref:hypothetical protein n=1 Tax=Streptomyces antimycoticus TaxID=68175 RepID=UPI003449FD4C
MAQALPPLGSPAHARGQPIRALRQAIRSRGPLAAQAMALHMAQALPPLGSPAHARGQPIRALRQAIRSR